VTDFASYLLYHCHSCQEVCFNPVTDRCTRYRECRSCHSVLLFLAHRANGKGVAKHLRAMPDAVQVHRKRAPGDDGHVEEYAADLRDGEGEKSETVRERRESGKLMPSTNLMRWRISCSRTDDRPIASGDILFP